MNFLHPSSRPSVCGSCSNSSQTRQLLIHAPSDDVARSRCVSRVASLEVTAFQTGIRHDLQTTLDTQYAADHLGRTYQSGPAASDDLTEEDVEPEARAMGCIMGAMCGNVLGAPVQHDRHWQVSRMFPQGLTEFWGHDMSRRPVQRGHATGEFQQLLAVSHSLLTAQCCDVRVLAYELASRCDPEERRCTPHSEYILKRLRADGAQLDSMQFLASLPAQAAQFYANDRAKAASSFSDRWDREPWGPADHGAAATVAAPIAVAYRTCSWEVVENAVQEACLLTHSHPIGIDGARVMAAAVHWLLQQPSPALTGVNGTGGAVGPQALLAHLMTIAKTQDMRSKLELLQQQLFQADEIGSWPAFYRGRDWHRLTSVLSRVTYHDLATAGTEATAVALWAFCTHWRMPRQAVCVSAVFGGSAPATTQMVGALAGALHGTAWIPSSWWKQLENVPGGGGEDWESWQLPEVSLESEDEGWKEGGEGPSQQAELGMRDEALEVAKRLAALQCTSVGLPSPEADA